MRRVASKLLVVVVIVVAAFCLDLKLDLFPAAAESEEVAALDETNKIERLELELAKHFKARSERFSVTYTGTSRNYRRK